MIVCDYFIRRVCVVCINVVVGLLFFAYLWLLMIINDYYYDYLIYVNNYLWFLWLFMIVCESWWLFMNVDDYLWLLLIILCLLWYVNVVCINGGLGSLFSRNV